MMLNRIFIALIALLSLAAAPVGAQDPAAETVVPMENVRYDYAQVLSVRPVQQVLRTTTSERVCDSREPARSTTLARVMNIAKLRMAAESDTEPVLSSSCRMQPVVKEHRRTIAYDVDYVYRGSKFRTRMDHDPGNRLRIRISIMPYPFD
jgi:uncharacterized protein YcfJ